MNFIATTLLLGLACSASADTWSVEFFDGEECTGSSTGTVNGPQEPDQGSYVCNFMPDYSVAKSLFLRESSTAAVYVLGYHAEDDCELGPTTVYSSGTEALCVPGDDTITAFSITTVPSGTSRKYTSRNESSAKDIVTVPERQSQSSILDPPDVGALNERQVVTTAAFALAALSQATSWIDNAVTRCKSTTATEENASTGSCGIAVVWSTLYSFITVFGSASVYYTAGQAGLPRRDSATIMPDVEDVFHYMAESEQSFIRGYSTNLSALDPYIDNDGLSWDHFMLTHTNEESGLEHSARYRRHKATGQHQILADYDSGADVERLEKRQDDQDIYTAYIGWRDGLVDLESTLPRSDDIVNKLTVQVYNYGKNNNAGQFCTDLRGMDGGQVYRTLAYGDFAFIKGPFVDRNSECSV